MIQEGIDLQEMAVSAFIATIFLAIFVSLYNYNHQIQSKLEEEQTHQALNQAYAKIAAYDDTDLNGQDVLSFITRYRGAIPVVFCETGGDHDTQYVVTSKPSELVAIINGSGSTDWPYTIYYYDRVNSGSGDDTLVKEFTAADVYNADSTNIVNYADGSPESSSTSADLNAQQLLDEYSDYIKTNREAQLSSHDGLYGTWHSVVYFKDVSCREPECIKVWPVE